MHKSEYKQMVKRHHKRVKLKIKMIRAIAHYLNDQIKHGYTRIYNILFINPLMCRLMSKVCLYMKHFLIKNIDILE